MKKLVIFPAMLLFLVAVGQTGWRQGLQYRIGVKLNEKQQELDGKMELLYTNHSPDTLHFIWFHVWPDAYRNDKTSYSEQLLENGKTGFYFSEKESRGYINHLEFRIAGATADIQDHPEYLDVVKLVLPHGLDPGDSVQISVSFHVKLPFNFSGSGYRGHNDQISNWYPEPAVYDRKGWHPMPFLEQGGAYHESADYQVHIEVPNGYIVATGCQPDSISGNDIDGYTHYFFSIHHANAFSWVADKRLMEKKDTVHLDGGKHIELHLFYLAQDDILMQKQLTQAKPLIRTLSRLLTEYPYGSLNIIETTRSPEQSFSGMIQLDATALKSNPDGALRKALVAQWFQAICLSDERQHPWLSKGFTQYYTRRLNPISSEKQSTRTALKDDRLWLRVAEKERTTQPIGTASPALSQENYLLIAGTKASLWIESLEDTLGEKKFDQIMHVYFDQWKFGHPYPEDFKRIVEKVSDKNVDSLFEKIHRDEPLLPPSPKKILRAAFLFSSVQSDKYNYVNLAPMIGYNRYDQFMIGAMIHNFNLPENNFQFLFIPLYATGSKSLEGIGRISYSWHPGKSIRKITLGLNGSRFSSNYAKDSTGTILYEGFSKLVPYLRIDFRKYSPRSTLEKWMDFKSYLIHEKGFTDYAVSSKDSLIHPNASSGSFRYLNQWSMNLRDGRTLYPYDARLELQQSDLFYRVNLSAHYFFNYPSGGGMTIRFFASKFGVWNVNSRQDLSRYEPKLLGVTGNEDYTYDQYFVGRSSSYALENTSLSNGGLPARQIMIRDGGLKLRLDPYGYIQGRSANWVSALNFSTTLPAQLFPVPVPIRIFFDVGTYAEAWKTNAETSRFLYTGGIQLSLLKNLLNIYAPLIYSSDFRDLIKTGGFGKRITFSIDIQNLDSRSKEEMLRHEFRN
ncbi:MAG: M1 family metallopeptidase [Bacteroidota bacterium]|nr:M1 family metallopeptidase [Bacteroidota bacterium]